MRRSPIILTATAAGLAAVLGFDAHQPALPTASASATPAPADPPASSSGSTRTATGDAIDTRYGAAQVKVTISGGKITDVQALQLQGNDPKSVQISSSAEPQLRASALAKQSAAIDAVSGATITSASYEASLQSALDKLGFKAPDGSRGSSTIPDVEEHHDGPFG
ncbi:FMN-binding protein [Solirubrobacter soli]|uniref:FMN-binding protein n=1 Tax=Solirubrobacter soli TaxID=363832 RepID=UPI00069D30FD|nr:FMN-binding protein [Solirubrobacter soli]